MKMPANIKDIFEKERIHQLATASKNGEPNCSYVGAKYLLDDETIIIVDNFMKKTLKNILENPNVAIAIIREKETYQIKGTCEYLTKGPIYEEARKWMKAKGDRYPAKGALLIKVTDIFYSTSDEKAGLSI
ncbi:MAG TPA: pyridoxamine 5'-phosphate oxidase family protein [Methanofastidiosum sp.]|nr:pyridoxamine 5'-phosphate oxidase family protein [Methanofastidiosum sp.]